MAVYGTNQVPYTEEMIPCPEDPYGTAKFAVEQDLEHAHRLFGLDYTIFRPHNIVGTRQHIGDTFRNVVGIFVNQVMQEKPMTIFGDGEQTRAFSYVKDIVPYIAECINKDNTKGQVYNV
jgi:UDP-glucose 4-epimerase